MYKESEFNDILDNCLDEMLIHGETVENCLLRNAEYAVELEPLLQTASMAGKASSVEPSPEFRERAGYQFRAALEEMDAKRSSHLFGWQPRWATTAIAIVVFLLAGSGTVAASGNSMPDEILYSVKLATETVRLTLTPSVVGKAELYVELVDERVAEIVYMSDKGNVAQIDEAVGRLDNYLTIVVNLATLQGLDADTLTAPAPQVMSEADPLPAPTAPVTETAPVPQPSIAAAPPPIIIVPPAAMPGKSSSGRGQQIGDKEQYLAEDSSAPPAETPQTAESLGVGSKGGVVPEGSTDSWQEIQIQVASKAASNTLALQQALDTAPEAAKQALLRALNVSNNAYGKALQALD